MRAARLLWHTRVADKKTVNIREAIAVCLLLALCGCNRGRPAYTPALGEIMTLTQMRHAKLWLAGKSKNWPLAAYEVDELEEGFADAAAYHPTHKTSPVRLERIIPLMTGEPLKSLRKAIADQDPQEFQPAFDSLTKACNGCHQATNFGFNVVIRPSANTFSNQDFRAAQGQRSGTTP